jgi:hypothetical protein
MLDVPPSSSPDFGCPGFLQIEWKSDWNSKQDETTRNILLLILLRE